MSRICSRSWSGHTPGEHPHSSPTGAAARGGDLAEGVESSFCFFPSFLLLQGLVGMSPVKTWTHIPLACPSPFPLLADSSPCVCPHRDSLHPSGTALAPSLSGAVGERGDLSSQNPLVAPPFPQPFSLPPCRGSEERIGWISAQRPALPCSAPAGG